MSNTTSLRRLGVVLAAVAIAGLGVSCVPETPTGEPPDPCATPTVAAAADVTADVTSGCPTPCPSASAGGTANITQCPNPCTTPSATGTANVTQCPNPCTTPSVADGVTANVTSNCPTPCPTSALAPGANVGGTCPTTPTTPPQPCNAATLSGGDGVTSTVHGLGVTGPTSFLFEFNAQSQPDRFQIFYEGVEILDTGWRGSPGPWNGPDGNPITIEGPGLGSATVAVPAGASMDVTVVVTGQGPGTVWGYEVNCPTPPV